MKIAIATILQFFLLYSLSVTAQDMDYFSQDEFPNLLLIDSSESKLAESEVLLSKALQSIFTRLQIPIVIEGRTVMINYFSYITEELRKIDPNVKVFPSGGVVRSTIGYLYHLIHKRMSEDPSLSPKDILLEVINSKLPLPGYEVRGVGSDFDLLIRDYELKNFTALKNRALVITNSAETEYKATKIKGDYKKSIFTIGDVKDYITQISRSTKQGGADIDFLAFDIENSKFILPDGHPDIIKNLLLGVYQYLAPQGNNAEDADKQTIRGMRALLELPFLTIKDPAVFIAELYLLIEKVQSGKKLDTSAIEQFGKTTRNARFSGAHNRVFRGKPGSLEEHLFKLILAVEKAHAKSTVPEFVDELPLGRKKNSIPKELVVSHNDFINKWTDAGTLYHGTPTLESALSILRGGLILSGGVKQQGLAVYGRGGYTSKLIAIAKGYAKNSGMIIRLNVKKDSRLLIIDLTNVKNHPFIEEVKAKFPNRDLHEVLARVYGVDIIINHHVLIQNINAVKYPTDITVILELLGAGLEQRMEDFTFGRYDYVSSKSGTHYKLENLYKGINEYLNILKFAQALGIANSITIPKLHLLPEKLIHSEFTTAADINLFVELSSEFNKLNLLKYALPESTLKVIAEKLVNTEHTTLHSLTLFLELCGAYKKAEDLKDIIPKSILTDISEKLVSLLEINNSDYLYILSIKKLLVQFSAEESHVRRIKDVIVKTLNESLLTVEAKSSTQKVDDCLSALRDGEITTSDLNQKNLARFAELATKNLDSYRDVLRLAVQLRKLGADVQWVDQRELLTETALKLHSEDKNDYLSKQVNEINSILKTLEIELFEKIDFNKMAETSPWKLTSIIEFSLEQLSKVMSAESFKPKVVQLVNLYLGQKFQLLLQNSKNPTYNRDNLYSDYKETMTYAKSLLTKYNIKSNLFVGPIYILAQQMESHIAQLASRPFTIELWFQLMEAAKSYYEFTNSLKSQGLLSKYRSDHDIESILLNKLFELRNYTQDRDFSYRTRGQFYEIYSAYDSTIPQEYKKYFDFIYAEMITHRAQFTSKYTLFKHFPNIELDTKALEYLKYLSSDIGRQSYKTFRPDKSLAEYVYAGVNARKYTETPVARKVPPEVENAATVLKMLKANQPVSFRRTRILVSTKCEQMFGT